MKHTFIKIVLLFIALSSSSCFKINQKLNPQMRKIVGSQKVIDDIRPLNDFHSIQIEWSVGEIFLVQDTINQIRLNGEDNILPEIHDTVINGVLTLFNSAYTMIRYNDAVTVYVHFKNIDEIISDQGTYKTIGKIKTTHLNVKSNLCDFELNLEADTLNAEISGNGKCHSSLTAKGFVNYSNITLTMSGVFDSPELKGNYCYINFEENCCYHIKVRNFSHTNILIPTNCINIPNFWRLKELIEE